ncbi:MAG: hypothetical protein IJ196_06210 [Prevotella sp.]|nr:hypothetical protein [Prevotella sp.]
MRKTVVFLFLMACLTVAGQSADDVFLLKDPSTGKWGYASKIQNRKSPLKGVKKMAVNVLGKAGSAMLDADDAAEIDW